MDSVKIGNKLKELRGSLSREELAIKLGVSLSAIQMWESGERVPRDAQKIALAKFYGVTVESIFFN